VVWTHGAKDHAVLAADPNRYPLTPYVLGECAAYYTLTSQIVEKTKMACIKRMTDRACRPALSRRVVASNSACTTHSETPYFKRLTKGDMRTGPPLRKLCISRSTRYKNQKPTSSNRFEARLCRHRQPRTCQHCPTLTLYQGAVHCGLLERNSRYDRRTQSSVRLSTITRPRQCDFVW